MSQIKKSKLETLCIVNNYNYAKFIEDALLSLENQTLKFDKVIIVDDKSKDNSIKVIKPFLKAHKNWILIAKDKNQGALSCLNAASLNISEDSVVFMLDSDDFYPTEYLKNIMTHYDENTDFLFVRQNFFSKNKKNVQKLNTNSSIPAECYYFPLSSSLTRLNSLWLGTTTSCISLRGWLLKKILPYSDDDDFKNRIDDVLILASSILGARKKFVKSEFIYYRLHEENLSKLPNSQYRILRKTYSIEKLNHVFSARANISPNVKIANAFRELKQFSPSHKKIFHIPSALRILVRYFLS